MFTSYFGLFTRELPKWREMWREDSLCCGWLPGLMTQALFPTKTGTPCRAAFGVNVWPCLCESHQDKWNSQDLTQCNSVSWTSPGSRACQGCGAVDWALRIPVVNLAFVIYLTFILISAACCIDPSVKIEAGSDSCILTSCYTTEEGKGHQKVLVPLLQ